VASGALKLEDNRPSRLAEHVSPLDGPFRDTMISPHVHA
jgi:hypothetical protein